MQTVNIHEAKTQFSRYVDQGCAGVEIIIARAGKPVARLVALASAGNEPRKLGKINLLSLNISTAFMQRIGSRCSSNKWPRIFICQIQMYCWRDCLHRNVRRLMW